MKPAITIDKEFRDLIPPLRDGELALLESSLIHEGCRDELVVWNGTLLDGHNRHTICQREGLVFKTKEIELADRNAAKLWIIDNQMGRRNIADIDRIGLQSAREEVLREIGKASYKANVGRPSKSSAKLPTISKVNTRATCAKLADVGERTYDAGKLVLDAEKNGEIPKAVVDEVRNGRKAIHAVAKEVKEKRQKAARETKRTEAAKTAPANDRIIIGDFRKHADKVADGSLSLIFTDPPYDREASKMLPALAEFAKAKLAEGGSLICYVGQTQLPAALDAFRPHLRYWWTIACVHAGRATVMREYGINAGWKAVLWFVKGTRDDNSVMVDDVMSGGEEKQHHDWQQSESEAAYWIEKLCPKDGIVCDPFLGGGTTAAAAESLKRKWIAFEIDKDNAAIAAGRIAQ